MEISPAKRGHEGGAGFFQSDKKPSTYLHANTLLLRKAGESPGDEFSLDGHRVEQVQIICRLAEIHESAQRYEFVLEDEAGRFKGVIYRNSQGSTRVLQDFDLRSYRPSEYVTILGHLRKFQEVVVLLLNKLLLTNKYEEVIGHRVAVLWGSLVRRGKYQEAPKPAVLRERTTTENRDEFAHLPSLQQDIIRTLKRLMDSRNCPVSGINKVELMRELRSKPMDKEFESNLQSLLLYGYLMDGDPNCYVPAT